ncbi:MAG: carboxylesterase family protein [Pseudomonadota bacterium]
MRKSLFALAGLLIATACGDRSAEVPAPVVDPASTRIIDQGLLVGFTHQENPAHVWLSIPYAAPPVGDLRWRAPQPAPSWEDSRRSLTEAPWCPQVRGRLDDGSSADEIPLGEIMGQEDCLYLNIYAPIMSSTTAEAADLPVMMWIHGGSNVWGRAEQYDPSKLAAEENVVVAVIQYRLGPLGWFAHDSLRNGADAEDDRSANFAILDQIAALDWLADNVSYFGGDPGNITIFGESAGGHNVASLLGSPRASGKFHKAIIQSGSFRSVSLQEAEFGGERAGGSIARKLVGDDATADALRAVSVDELFRAYGENLDTEEWDPPRIIEDGIVIPEGGLRAAFDSTETFNVVPTISGTNKDETKLFNLLEPELVRWRFGRIPRARNRNVYNAVSEYQSRMWRVIAVDDPLSAMADAGHSDLFAYRFDWDEASRAWGADFSELFGAAHGLEIPFVFGQFRFLGDADRWVFTEKNEPGRLALNDAMMAYWAEFARTGQPGSGGTDNLPNWSTWSAEDTDENIILFDSPEAGGPRMVASQESAAGVAEDLFADTRLQTTEITCRVYLATVYWNEDLAAHDAEGCLASTTASTAE